MRAFFFVHIPKTAGTSFRLGVQSYFGDGAIFYDYGQHSSETSGLVQEYLYGASPDFWRFYRACEKAGATMVGGHVSIARFVLGTGVSRAVTFLRDPLQRVISEYKHFVRHHGYTADFRTFYKRAVMCNRQSKLLQGVPLEAVGFVGVTERYADSVRLFNAQFGLDVRVREDNRAKAAVDDAYGLGAADAAALQRLNQQDLTLYERAGMLFETRLALFRAGLPYVHAKVQEATLGRIAGWAWWASGGDEAVAVDVLVNGERVGTARAVELRPGLCRLWPPRGAHVGFSLKVNAEAGDQVQCRVAETGQVFPPQPMTVCQPANA